MRKYTFLFLILLFSLCVLPVTAQDADCMLDLSLTSTVLVRAQAAVSSGDSDQAVELMEEVRTQLERIETLCGEAASEGADNIDTINLSNTYTIASQWGTLTFNYPDGWQHGENNQDTARIGNTASALDNNSNPSIDPGEKVMFIRLLDVERFHQSSPNTPPDVLEMLEDYLDYAPNMFQLTMAPIRFILNDRPAAQVNLVFEKDNSPDPQINPVFENTEIIFLLVDLEIVKAENVEHLFCIIMALVPRGENSAEFESTIRAVAETFNLK